MTPTTLIQLVADTELALQQALDQQLLSLGHGTHEALDEAAWLVLWSLGLPLDSELDHRPVTADDARKAQALLAERLSSRKPLAYLTQEAWLHGVPFYVDERVIVPRSLIAEPLIQGALDAWLPHEPQRILDLCTGNGSLAVLSAMVYASAQVDGADISTDALAVARINAQKHGLQDRLQWLVSDGLANVTGAYDFILCNPPYVNASSMAALPTEYQQEPEISLAGGTDGMDFIRPMLAQVAQHLSEQGFLVLEIGHERGYFEAAFANLEPFWLSTSAGDDQVLLLTREQCL